MHSYLYVSTCSPAHIQSSIVADSLYSHQRSVLRSEQRAGERARLRLDTIDDRD